MKPALRGGLLDLGMLDYFVNLMLVGTKDEVGTKKRLSQPVLFSKYTVLIFMKEPVV